MNNSILQYQKLDGTLLEIEKNLKTNESRKMSMKLTSYKQDAEDRLVKIEAKAGELSTSLNNAIANINTVKETLDEHIKAVEDLEDIEEIKYLKKKIASELETLDNHDKTIKGILDEINAMQDSYNDISAKLPKAVSQLASVNEAFGKIVAEVKPQIDSLKEEKKELEKSLDASLLAEYKKVRAQNLYPVFVELGAGNTCAGCHMTTSVDFAEMDAEGYVKCENCNRRVYKAD